jgi:dihydropteroate synthase
LILDPGLGFGKSRAQNFEILAHLRKLRHFGLPILVGTSRKSFVQAIAGGAGLDGDALNGSQERGVPAAYRPMIDNLKAQQARTLQTGDAAAVVASILGGAHIVRVHDVAGVFPAVRIADAMLKATRRARRRNGAGKLPA